MTLSMRAKISLAILVLVGLVTYLLVLELGINSGRIHYGVSINEIDVGGLTKEEAFRLLTDRGERLESAPVIFTLENLSCNFVPTELGWEAKPFETAIAAYRIGRGVSPLRALGARIRAWFGGVNVAWTEDLNSEAVTRIIDRCELNAEAVGYDLRRYALRKKIARVITTWPRRAFKIPTRS